MGLSIPGLFGVGDPVTALGIGGWEDGKAKDKEKHREMLRRRSGTARVDHKYGQHADGSGAMAGYYDDSWGQVLGQLSSSKGKGGTGGMLQSLLQNFAGSPEDLKNFMDEAKPFMAASLEGTKAFQEVQDYDKASNVMGAYGGAAGMIGQQQRAGLTGAQNTMARSGLGRSAAMAGLTQQAAGAAGGQQAQMYSNLYQSQLARRSDLAQRGLDAHRNVASLALGMAPQVRQTPSGGGIGVGQMIGTGLGTAVGSLYGPAGGMAGAAVGGAAGQLAD